MGPSGSSFLPMRVLLQRVSRAEVRVDNRVVGKIGVGYCLLVGFTATDTEPHLACMAEKLAALRSLPAAARTRGCRRLTVTGRTR